MTKILKKMWEYKISFIFIISIVFLLLWLNKPTQENQSEEQVYEYVEPQIKDFSHIESFALAFRTARNELGEDQNFLYKDELYSTNIKD